MERFRLLNAASIMLAFCCAFAIAAHAQTLTYGQLTGITGANPIGGYAQGKTLLYYRASVS